MTKPEGRMPNDKPQYDLEERTACLGERAIVFSLTLPETAVVKPLVSQFIRAVTSVGANYCEADNAESPKDFRHKIGLCRKEARESMFWCRMLTKAIPARREAILELWQEARELNLIFATIFRKTKPPS